MKVACGNDRNLVDIRGKARSWAFFHHNNLWESVYSRRVDVMAI